MKLLIPTREDLTKQLLSKEGLQQLRDNIPNFKSNTSDDRCHDDLRDFLKTVLNNKTTLLVNYPVVFESPLLRHPNLTHNDLYKDLHDKIDPSTGMAKIHGRRTEIPIGKKLKPGMVLHIATTIWRGKLMKRHYIMWLGKVPALGNAPYFFDSLAAKRVVDTWEGKIHALNPQPPWKRRFWRIIRIRDPWQGKEISGRQYIMQDNHLPSL